MESMTSEQILNGLVTKKLKIFDSSMLSGSGAFRIDMRNPSISLILGTFLVQFFA